MSRLVLCLIAAALSTPEIARSQPVQTDLREFRVGMPFAALPAQGYAEFKCAADATPIAGWSDYRKCPADAAGRYAIGFRYDDDGEHETKVAGQPVLLTLVIDGDGVLDTLQIHTDPSARLFLRKRGYIFGEQVMARYGDDGWACTQAKPTGRQEPIGGIFVREHCEKTIGSRRLVVDRQLYRDADKAESAFTSTTSFTVSLLQSGHG